MAESVIVLENKVFILGLPGSGKSTAARYIEELAQCNNWCHFRFNDYDILHEWFQADSEGKQFSSTPYNGFDVHDHIVFDNALNELERRVLNRKSEQTSVCEKNELIIVEFSRNDYCRALEMFTPEFLQNAWFLFINVDIPTCKQRIKERAAHRVYVDDHYVSEYIFEAYYHLDDRQYLKSVASKLKISYAIGEERILVIDNIGSSSTQAFLESVKLFSLSIFGASVPLQISASTNISPEKLTTSHNGYREDVAAAEH